MPKYVKKEKKDKRNLLQMQTNLLVCKKRRHHSPSPSPSISSCDSFRGFGKENVKSEAAAKLRLKMAKLQKEIEKLDAPNEDHNVNNATSQNADENDDNQLFGKTYKDEDMVLLKNDIYCRKKILEMAQGCSFKPSHVARRLLEGVFKIEALLASTLTGQSPKSQGRERQMEKYQCLNAKAKRAIIEISIEYGEKRGWVQQSTYDINRALSQKIGELKRQHKRHEQ